MSILIKNCGLSAVDAVEASIAHGAHYLGFIHYEPSVRHVSAAFMAELSAHVPSHIQRVAVVVDADNNTLNHLISTASPDILQLHGDESIERVEDIKQRYKLPIIKAIGIATAQDVERALAYEAHVDHLLLDTKDDAQKGGTGRSFDWTLLQGVAFTKPWLLSGGLNASNVVEALSKTAAPMVDVSSGIESSRGIKDLEKIKLFNECVAHYEHPA